MLQQKAQAGNTIRILNRRTAYSIAGTHFFSELITMLILVAILVPLTGTSIAILTKIHTTMLLLGPRPRGHHPIRMQYTPDRMLAGRSTSAGGRGLGPWIRGGPSWTRSTWTPSNWWGPGNRSTPPPVTTATWAHWGILGIRTTPGEGLWLTCGCYVSVIAITGWSPGLVLTLWSVAV